MSHQLGLFVIFCFKENNQRPPGGGVPKQQQLPKYRMKPGLRNYMQISSMKITESGAKDLMNSQPVNKVRGGLHIIFALHEFRS